MDELGGSALAYEADLHAWALRQAALLRAGEFAAVDAGDVADEIESLGRAQASALQMSYRAVAAHLLRALASSEPMTRERASAILCERMDAQNCLRDSPSLVPLRQGLFDMAYRQARSLAAAETGLPTETFPIDPPFTVEELSSEGFTPWPEPRS